MPRIITVTANPCFDRTIRIGKFQFDDPNRVQSEFVEASGKGVNLSVLFDGFGVESVGYILAGESSYPFYRSLLPQGLELRPVIKKGAIRENMTICSEDGKLIKINRSGEQCSNEDIENFKRMLCDGISKDDTVIISGSMPPGLCKEDFKQLCLAVKERGCRLALDSEILDAALLAEIKPFVIKPNAEEFERLTGANSECLDEVIKQAKDLCNAGLEQILVSLGSKGLLGVTANQVVLALPPQVIVKSTVAAGDSSLAGFILNTDKGFEEAVGWGAAFGTAAVTLEGSGVPTLELVQEIHKQVIVKEL